MNAAAEPAGKSANDSTLIAPMTIGLRRYQGATARLAQLPALLDDRVLQILSLETADYRRRMGDAAKLLKMLVEEADISSTVLVLEPRPYRGDSPLDAQALIAWYRRYGFRTIQTEPIILMSRAPRIASSTRH
jgi:hypothetical protein